MGSKKYRMTIGLDKEDLDFLQDLNNFKNNSDGIRWCIKFVRIYGIPEIKAIKAKLKQLEAHDQRMSESTSDVKKEKEIGRLIRLPALLRRNERRKRSVKRVLEPFAASTLTINAIKEKINQAWRS